MIIYTQDGTSANFVAKGPFNITCDSESADQGFHGSDTNLPFDMVLTPGHICSTSISNQNYDGFHIKYADQYMDVPDQINGGGLCSKHDGGVSCQWLVHPP